MNRNQEFFSQLKDIITNNILNVSDSNIDEYYDYWQQNFNEIVSNSFAVSDKLIHENQLIPKDAVLKGIDLPTWFGDFKNTRIVILGIDPLRNQNNFKELKVDKQSEVIVGTPYSFNKKSSRDNDSKAYWTFVEGLKNANKFVYCTDIFKTYYYKEVEKIRSYNDSSFVLNKFHKSILEQELNLINPDIIIVFGGLAHKLLLSKKSCPKIGQSIIKTKSDYALLEKKSSSVYTVLHLSKTPRGNNFKDLFSKNEITSIVNVENRVECAEKYLEMFKQHGII